MKRMQALCAVAALVLAWGPATGAQSKPASGQAKQPPAPLKLKVGDVAPDFTLLAFDGQSVQPVSLHDYRGKKSVALAFYVFAFTGG